MRQQINVSGAFWLGLLAFVKWLIPGLWSDVLSFVRIIRSGLKISRVHVLWEYITRTSTFRSFELRRSRKTNERFRECCLHSTSTACISLKRHQVDSSASCPEYQSKSTRIGVFWRFDAFNHFRSFLQAQSFWFFFLLWLTARKQPRGGVGVGHFCVCLHLSARCIPAAATVFTCTPHFPMKRRHGATSERTCVSTSRARC